MLQKYGVYTEWIGFYDIDEYFVPDKSLWPVTGDKETLKWLDTCKTWRGSYSVVPGKTWGSLPLNLQEEWQRHDCDGLSRKGQEPLKVCMLCA